MAKRKSTGSSLDAKRKRAADLSKRVRDIEASKKVDARIKKLETKLAGLSSTKARTKRR
jgi:hypothetical protein